MESVSRNSQEMGEVRETAFFQTWEGSPLSHQCGGADRKHLGGIEMRTATNHFDDDDYQSYIDSNILSVESEDSPFPVWRSLDGDREYLASSFDNLRRFYSDRQEFIDEVYEINESYEEPDPDEIAAYWHEREGSL
jgi:hypothetical protein